MPSNEIKPEAAASSAVKLNTAPSGQPRARSQALVVVVMGVSGCGKSTVGLALAQRMGWRFVDADDFHPSANVEKMRAGIALTDDDRAPWLSKLNAVLRHSAAKGQSIVLACSALRERYRVMLADRLPDLRVVHLTGSFELIEARLKARQHRYMPAALLQSQFNTLEPPTNALTLDIARPVGEIVEEAAARLDDHDLSNDSRK